MSPADAIRRFGPVLLQWHKGTTLPVTYQDGKRAEWTVSGIYQGTDLLRGIITDTHTLAPTWTPSTPARSW
ncbi:hypothetical protein ACFW5D_28190 [Streptomyces sp. NPDC058770]|uniref:hypothetical protein n=1 Tax=Streptomyces sp. NPDC058770 TaxID=3346631 RepID=UPI00368F61CC